MRVGDSAAEYVSVSDLVPWADNPRLNDGEPVRKIAEAIQTYGFGAPIIARRANREIIAGHTRLKAAISLGMDLVPVRFLDVSEEQAHALAIADNRIGEESKWDEAKLAELLKQLPPDKPTGFDDAEMRELLAKLEPYKDDEDAEPDGPTHSTEGTVYELGPHRLVCGDSTDPEISRMALQNDEPLVWICDPPFDVPYDAWPLLPSVQVVAVWRRSKAAYSWMAQTFSDDAWGPHELVFTGGVRGQHNHTLPCCMHENVTVWRRHWWKNKLEAIDREVIRLSGCKRTRDDRPISWQEKSGGVVAAQSTGMSWAKPVMQSEMVIAYVPRGSFVWDPCAGSGSSLIASAKHGRVWRGVEKDLGWADLIRRRWTKYAAANRIDPGSGALE